MATTVQDGPVTRDGGASQVSVRSSWNSASVQLVGCHAAEPIESSVSMLCRLIAVSLLLSSCVPEATESITPSLDSVGVPIVRLPSLEASTAPEWTTELVYSTAGRDDLGLGRSYFLSAVLVDDSTLWVADGPRITMLGTDGTRMRTVGRSGGGPGEFQWEVSSLGLAEDGSIFAFELFGGRFTLFSPEGQLVSSATRLASAVADQESEVVAVLDGSNALTLLWQGRPFALGDTVADGIYHRNKVTLRLHDKSGSIIDSLGAWPGLQRAIGNLPIRFASGAVFDGRMGSIVIGTTDSLDFTLFRGTTRTSRFLGPPFRRAVTDAEIAAWREGVAHESPDADVFLDLATKFDQLAVMPTVGGVVLDDEGNLWIGEYATPRNAERRWHIISPTGTPIGRLSLPTRTSSLMPGRIELLDVAHGRLVLVRELGDGDVVIEVRAIESNRRR